MIDRSRSLALAAALLFVPATPVLLGTGCQKVKMPHEMAGPPGCGLRDPRQTAPGMLSLAQKKLHKEMGDPKNVEKNDKGGLNWIYQRKTGSVFGEDEKIEVYTFNGEGILIDHKTDVLYHRGK